VADFDHIQHMRSRILIILQASMSNNWQSKG